MNRISGIKTLLFLACLASPSLVFAGTQVYSPQDDSLTWTLVGARGPVAVDSQMPMDTGKISAMTALKNDEMPGTPARLGFYLGPASNPPVSIVGQDYQGDLASRVKYGFYLVSTF